MGVNESRIQTRCLRKMTGIKGIQQIYVILYKCILNQK